MTIMYKTLEDQGPQYLVNKLSFKTTTITTRNNTSNSKQLLVPFNRKKHGVTEVLVSQDHTTGINYQII